MAKTTTSSTKKKAAPSDTGELTDESVDPAAELTKPEGLLHWYELHLPEAKKLPKHLVVPFTGDATLAYHNAKIGLKAVLAHRGEVDASGLKVDWKRLEMIPSVALALVYAVSKVVSGRAANARLRKLLSDGWKLRDLLLSSADTLQKAGVFTAKEVNDIRKGKGLPDMAADLVALADLYTRRAADVKGKTPVTPAQVKDAAAWGAEILALLTPKGGRKEQPQGTAATREARDQIAALLVELQTSLERIGGGIWGRALDEHVPSLHSRMRPAKKTPKKPVTGGSTGASNPSATAGAVKRRA